MPHLMEESKNNLIGADVFFLIDKDSKSPSGSIPHRKPFMLFGKSAKKNFIDAFMIALRNRE